MPVFDQFCMRISANADWLQDYLVNIQLTKQTALRMPLLHVMGNAEFSFSDLMDRGSLPTSDDPKYCSDHTREKEREFQFQHSVYFYPGRAHECYGNVALAILPETESRHTGSVTWTGIYGSGRHSHLPNNHPAYRVSFVQSSTIDMRAQCGKLTEVPRWRDRLAKFLAAYFKRLSDYWETVPSRDDPEGIFAHYRPFLADWRAWTFEVRYHESVPLAEIAAWCPKHETWTDIRNYVSNRTDSRYALHPLNQLFATARRLPPVVKDKEDYEFTNLIEQWARTQ